MKKVLAFDVDQTLNVAKTPVLKILRTYWLSA